MPAELMLNFPDPTQVTVHLHVCLQKDDYRDIYMDITSAFVNPLTDKDIERFLVHVRLAVKAVCGPDSSEYEMVGGTRASERKKKDGEE